LLGAVLLTNSNKMSDIIKQTQMEQDVKTRTAVFQMFKSGDDISVSLIQRKCQVGYNSASRTFENLVEDGLIEKGKGNGVSKFL
jgi:DNA-binding transcriptional regulator YhcF (GntR family)